MSAPPTPVTRASDARDAERSAERRSTWSGVDQSGIMGAELVSAVLLWAGLGWLLDRWLGTDPWFLAIGALVGNAAGVYLIYLRAQRMDAAEAARAAERSAPRA
jgi:F0F1-type ATP synthase assembly protein I